MQGTSGCARLYCMPLDSALTPLRSQTRCQQCPGLAPACAAVPDQDAPAPVMPVASYRRQSRPGEGSCRGTCGVRLHGCLHVGHAGQSEWRTRAAGGRPQALRAGVHPYHHRCLGLYGCLASAARVACRRGGGGARVARWAACARLLLAGAAESLLAAGAAAPSALPWRNVRRGRCSPWVGRGSRAGAAGPRPPTSRA